jgi:hypothetical protein
MKQSVRDMVQYLADEKRMDPYDAYALLSLAGDVRISRTFRLVSNRPGRYSLDSRPSIGRRVCHAVAFS